MIKYPIEWIDTLTKREDVSSFALVMTLMVAVIVGITYLGMNGDIKGDVSFLEYYPTIEYYLTVKTFNILFLLGVVLNFSILMLYMHFTEERLDTKAIKSSIKQYLAYMILGYGGINLVLPVILFGVIFIIIIVESLKTVVSFLSASSDGVVTFLIDKTRSSK